MSEPTQSPTDNPIESSAEDRLGRAGLAHDFASGIRLLDTSKGAVIGILGPWGTGKSSFVNLMREQFAEGPSVTVVDFNPWMFSGTEQLVDHFFIELAASFKHLQDDRLTKAAALIEEYGESISSVAGLFGVWGQAVTGGLSLARLGAKRRLGKKTSAGARHNQVASVLSKLDRPVVIVIDDIDRLTTPEIRDIFKLVRLTASFPNLVYVLAFDRGRVEAALDETNVPGRAYLEKIIQVSFDLPATPDRLLMNEVLKELQNVMDGIVGERFDASRWSDVFPEVIFPLIGSMRDVARLSLSARATIHSLASDVETVDLLAMESIRVFRPEIFMQLREMRAAPTRTEQTFSGSGKMPEHQAQVDELIRVAGSESDLIERLVERVFPAAIKYFANNHYGSDWAPRWRKERRMACGDFLGMYFDRVAPTGLQALQVAEGLVSVINEPVLFKSTFDQVPTEMLPDVLSVMESFEGDFSESGMESAIAALLNAIPRVPEDSSRTGGLFALRPETIVIRLVLRMLEQLKDNSRRMPVVLASLTEVGSFSSKLQLVNAVGHRENIGSKVVSEESARELESSLAHELSHSSIINFEAEWDLARVYDFLSEQVGNAAILADEMRPEAIRAVLESVRGENRAQSMGTRHVRLTPVLAWEWLVSLYGDEQNLKNAVDVLRQFDGDVELVELADKYSAGWRPDQDDQWGDSSSD